MCDVYAIIYSGSVEGEKKNDSITYELSIGKAMITRIKYLLSYTFLPKNKNKNEKTKNVKSLSLNLLQTEGKTAKKNKTKCIKIKHAEYDDHCFNFQYNQRHFIFPLLLFSTMSL
jgi:hypothetical protein